jgi:hypothetical protein
MDDDLFVSLQFLKTETWVLLTHNASHNTELHLLTVREFCECLQRLWLLLLFWGWCEISWMLAHIWESDRDSVGRALPTCTASSQLLLTVRSNYTDVPYWLALGCYHFRSPKAESNYLERIWKESVMTWWTYCCENFVKCWWRYESLKRG